MCILNKKFKRMMNRYILFWFNKVKLVNFYLFMRCMNIEIEFDGK